MEAPINLITNPETKFTLQTHHCLWLSPQWCSHRLDRGLPHITANRAPDPSTELPLSCLNQAHTNTCQLLMFTAWPKTTPTSPGHHPTGPLTLTAPHSSLRTSWFYSSSAFALVCLKYASGKFLCFRIISSTTSQSPQVDNLSEIYALSSGVSKLNCHSTQKSTFQFFSLTISLVSLRTLHREVVFFILKYRECLKTNSSLIRRWYMNGYILIMDS